MATQFNWGFSNTQATEVEVNPIDVKFRTNYTVLSDNATQAVYDNKTAPQDLGERVQLSYADLKKVTSLCDVANPGKVSKGYQFKVRLDAVKRATFDSGDVVDSPLSLELSVRGLKDGITNDVDISTLLTRLLGCCYDTTTHTWRFNDLMRSGLQINED